MDPLLETLNQAQREAVLHQEGPLLTLAGPGSGKTRVVTHRVAHLLRSGVPASQILALTFTNKASSEMRNRIMEMAPGQQVWVSTFHRFGARLIRQYADFVGLTPNFTIYDTADAKKTLKRSIDEGNIDLLHYTPERVAAAISAAKNRLITPDKYEPQRSSPLSQLVAEIYPVYQQRLQASSAVDFDDLLLYVALLLYQNADLRATLDERFRYILVDEYQDTNHAQYVILRALSVDHPNLAVTGDPDQSIYGWRGANIENILKFESDYPKVRVVRLEKNYRSSKHILRVADQLIGFNRQRKKKSLYTDNDEGAPVRLIEYASGTEEAREIAAHIAREVACGNHRASDFAIIYRINALSRSLEKALHAAGVPYQLVRGLEFYQRKEIKDVLGYCQLINNPRDDQAVLRTINTPIRGIGSKTIGLIIQHATRHGITILEAAREVVQVDGLRPRAMKLVSQYVQLIGKLSHLADAPMEEILGTVLEVTNYRQYLQESDTEEDLNRLANIEELLTDARQFDEKFDDLQAEESDGPAVSSRLEAYLEDAWLVNDTDQMETETDQVTLLTLHASKGLEFPVVFLIAIEQGLLPHERSSSDPSQLEEERRLAFVGITRAQQQLQLSHTTYRDFRGQRRRAVPSSFLFEMPREEMNRTSSADENCSWNQDDPNSDHSFNQDHENQYHQGPHLEESFDAEYLEPASGDPSNSTKATAAISIQTASQMTDQEQRSTGTAGQSGTAGPSGISPNQFMQGMAVIHPELGPGKIVALSGAGKNRRATVRFVTAGERRYVLAHSPLRPAGS
jgi:DNA helicase-2/ATP-dependent DNA helicase PcrA